LSEIHLKFLGPIQFTHSTSGEIAFANRKALALLAFLAVESDRPHSRETLMGLLWPELPTAAAQNNLRVTWAYLRKHLRDTGNRAQPFLIGTRLELQFNPQSDHTLDVTRFLELLAACRTHQHPNRLNCPECSERLARALELVGGKFLEEFSLGDCPAFEEWLFVQRERLHLQVMDLLEELAQAAETAGSYEQATAYTRRQLELDSLHDSAQHRLLRLLAYQGQHNQALSQYQAIRALLNEELGIEPDTEMVQLAAKIESRSLPLPENAQSVDQVPSRKLNNLPENLTPFFGREKELEQLIERLAAPSYRLITLVGPGGIGKTRMAIETARSTLHLFKHGAFFVPLEEVAAAEDIPVAIAQALNVTLSGGGTPEEKILQILQDKHLLLVIDNLEHIVNEGVALLQKILLTAPKVVLLVTTRERLSIQVEDLFLMRGLPYPGEKTETDIAHYAAVRLFVDRAHRLNKTFKLSDETRPHVAEICRLVEGLPLGLELAATWIRELPAAHIAASLSENIDLLDTDLRDIPPRQRNLAAVFEHSWQLLTPDEQAVLPQLAVFRGGFTPAAAAEIANASPLILAQLHYKSLVHSSGNGRYAMHDLLRQLAMRKLKERPNATAQYKTRHSRYFLDMLASQAKLLTGVQAAQVGKTLRLDIDNIQHGWHWAVDSADWKHLQKSTAGLVAFYSHTGLVFQGVQLLQTAVDSPQLEATYENDLMPFMLTKQLSLLVLINTLDEIHPLITRILSLAQQNPRLSRLEAETYLRWSYLALEHSSDPDQARTYLDRAFSLISGIDDSELEAGLYNESGRNYISCNHFDRGVEAFQKSLTLFESLGHLLGQAITYDRLSGNYAEKFRLGQALDYGLKALSLYSQLDYRTRLGVAHHNLAATYILLGAYDQALEHAHLSLELAQQQANKIDEARALSRLARIRDMLGRTEEAEDNYRAAVASLRMLKLNFDLSYTLLEWGDFQLRAGQMAEAKICFDEALRINQDREHFLITKQIKLAIFYLAQGKQPQALKLVNEMWLSLKSLGERTLPFPIETLFECYTIFQACGDSRAEKALNMAADLLKRTSDEIDDLDLRKVFLNDVPVNLLLQTTLRINKSG
jgi:predicted ATPase/DNA-binding SARP family transcriptional activator